MNFSFRFYIYKNLLLLHVQRGDLFFFTIPWKSGMSLYICVWLCVNEITFALKGSGNVSPMEETRRLGQISSYQRISSLDVVRVKPNKKYKLIFTVIICWLNKVTILATLSWQKGRNSILHLRFRSFNYLRTYWHKRDQRTIFFCSALLHCEVKSAILISTCHQFYKINFTPKKILSFSWKLMHEFF